MKDPSYFEYKMTIILFKTSLREEWHYFYLEYNI